MFEDYRSDPRHPEYRPGYYSNGYWYASREAEREAQCEIADRAYDDAQEVDYAASE